MSDIDTDFAGRPVLKRELTDITDEVRAVDAPPTPILAEPYDIRAADAGADAELVSEWMNRPHLVEAWEYDWAPDRWSRYLQAQLDGEYHGRSSRASVASPSGTSSCTGRLGDSIAPRYAADPYDIGMHAAIADLRFVNRGMGPILLPRIVASVFELRTELPEGHVRSWTIATTAPAGYANGRDANSWASTRCPTGRWLSTRCCAHPTTLSAPPGNGRTGSGSGELGVAVVVGLHGRGHQLPQHLISAATDAGQLHVRATTCPAASRPRDSRSRRRCACTRMRPLRPAVLRSP